MVPLAWGLSARVCGSRVYIASVRTIVRRPFVPNMCWSTEISLLASLYGFGVSMYLRHRNYSKRDKWYALFLATFTATQLFDAVFWYLKGDRKDIPCVPINYYLSRFLLPPVLFFQPWVLSLYPSQSCTAVRKLYRLLTILGCCVMIYVYKCSEVWKTATGPDRFPTIFIGAAMFVSPFRYCLQIILVGGCVLTLLVIYDGTIVLLSKMCTYCLLLSIVWVLEPLWSPPDDAETAGDHQKMVLPLLEATVVHDRGHDAAWAEVVA
eukprot:Stramenopile-MAST_4_protein_3862